MDDKLLTGIFAILGFLVSAGVNFCIEIVKERFKNNKERNVELYIPVLTQIKLLRHQIEIIKLINGELEIISEAYDLERPGRYEELVNLRALKEADSANIIKKMISLCIDRLTFSRPGDFDKFIALREFLSSAASKNEIYNPDLVPPLSDDQLQTLIKYESYFYQKVTGRFSFG